MILFLLFILMLLPRSLPAMKVNQVFDTSTLTAPDLVKRAIYTLQQRHPEFTVNPSTDIKNLSFLSIHLPENFCQKKVDFYEKELSTLYLITLQRLDSVETALPIKKSFFVDIKRLYILSLMRYPENTQAECALLAHYFSKPALNKIALLKTVPNSLKENLENLINDYKEQYPNLTLVTINSLDKRSEKSGYFVLIRLREKESSLIYQTVYELQTKRQILWDQHCKNMADYYEKNKEILSMSALETTTQFT